MTEIITVAIKETKMLVRDVGALVMLFLLPAVFIVIMSAALQGAFASEETGERLEVLLVDQSGGSEWTDRLAEAIDSSRRFRVVREIDGAAVTRRQAEAAIRRGTYRIGVVVPAGVDDAVELEAERTVQVVVDPALSEAYAVSVQAIVDGVASTTIIGGLVDRTRELGAQAEKAAAGAEEAKAGAERAKAAVGELKTKIEGLAEAQRSCVEKLESTAQTAKMLDEKLRSIKTKLKAAGFDTDRWPQGGGQKGQKKSTDKHDDKPRQLATAGEADDETGLQDDGADRQSIRPGQLVDGGLSENADADADADEDAVNEAGASPDAGDGGAERRGVRVEQEYVAFIGDGPTPNSVQQQVPGWTIFALFWIVQILSVNMIRERLSGAFRRILVAPIPLWKFLVGSTIPFFVVNLLQAVVMFAIGVFLLPLIGCPRLVITDVPALFLVTAALSLAALGLGLLMASLSKTVFFAASVSAILIVIMAIMGGIMVPRVIMPAYMQRMGYWVPHGWALDGYLDVLVRGESGTDVLDTVYALLGFAAVFFVVAMIRFRRLARVQ